MFFCCISNLFLHSYFFFLFSAHELIFNVIEHTFFVLELMYNVPKHKTDAKKQKNILTTKLF